MICNKVQRAVSALPGEFQDQVAVENVDATFANSKQAVKKLGFKNHGLVIRDQAGSVLFKQNDHTVKMPEVRSAIKDLVSSSPR